MLSEQRKDRLAAVAIRCGGSLVILVVVAIVVNISLESLPLLLPVGIGPLEQVVGQVEPLAVGSDSRREMIWWLSSDGEVWLRAVAAGQAATSLGSALETNGGPLLAVDQEIGGAVSLLQDGPDQLTAHAGRVRFRDRWNDGHRHTEARWQSLAPPLALTADVDFAGVTAVADEQARLLLAVWTEGGRLDLNEWDPELETWRMRVETSFEGLRRVALAQDLRSMAVVDGRGRLAVLELPSLQRVELVSECGPVAMMRFLVSGASLVVVEESGAVSVWLEVPRARAVNRSSSPVTIDGVTVEPGSEQLLADDELGRRLAWRDDVEVLGAAPAWMRVRTLPSMPTSPVAVSASHRRRCFLVASQKGHVGLYHSTSGRRLDLDRWADGPVRALSFDPKGNGAVAGSEHGIARRTIDNPHPEISLRTLFAPVWYEGYAAPRRVWQSTGGSDSFEPKLSVWPLLFGTLKATLYAMLISVPLALLAALYISQVAPPWIQAVVKPTVELMAAVPSVIIGFLAALWLAPRIEAALFETLLVGLAAPLVIMLAMLTWRLTPPDWRRLVPAGGELVLLVGSAAVVWLVVSVVGEPLEGWLFDGDLRRYLFSEHGIRYDQRNGLVVGIGLGFAVIPVIFTLAEDACSSVPGSLVAASRALGATRWQTATRLVVPAASPGLFAAVMLGFGRAVGETMIVLMAAGNTPLLDISPFDGMRTMSAAIAVEIPEAAVGGTLYRVLFLIGTLLFLLTLAVSTAADLVAQALRRRYGRL